jgi:hypothetical protein
MKFQAMGIVFIVVCVVLDTVTKLRMKSIGVKWVFLRGGTFDYREYLNIRKKYGWPAWPVYLIAPTLLLGIFFLILGFVVRYGATTNHN